MVFEQVGDGVATTSTPRAATTTCGPKTTPTTTTRPTVAQATTCSTSTTATPDGAVGGPGFDTCVVDATIEAADTCEQVVVR